MALCTHFEQTEIGCPRIAEFTVQRTETLFDHITGLRQISVAFGLRFRQRMFTVGFAHNAVLQPMLFQMLPVFLDENKFPITDNPTLYVDSYAKMIWDPSDFNTPNMNDNAQTNKEYQHLANRLLITQPIVERLNSQNYTQNSEEFDKAETELNSILHKYRYNRLKDFLTDVTPIKLKQLQGQNLTSEEHNLLQDANLAFQYHTRLKMFSDNIYRKGMNVQSDILKEKFPHLKDKIISANKPDNYTENGKVVGLISDFGAVKFIMYTNPEQNQILKTRFIIE